MAFSSEQGIVPKRKAEMRRNQNGNRDITGKWKKGEKTEKETSQFVTVKSFFNT